MLIESGCGQGLIGHPIGTQLLLAVRDESLMFWIKEGGIHNCLKLAMVFSLVW